MSMIKAAVLAAIVAMAFGMSFAQAQNMATLFYNLDETNTAEITDFLQKNKYKLDKDGRNILVPKDIVYEVRMILATAGLPKIQSNEDYTTFMLQELTNERRMLEVEFARSIESFKEVDHARVHLSIPKQKGEDITASVILRIRSGEVLQHKQMRGIQHLVASAIVGLKLKQVNVLDDGGNLLTKGDEDIF
jgi:flagellar M-ring protein FliF